MNDITQKHDQQIQVCQQDQAQGIPSIATNSAALILDESSMQRMESLALSMSKGRVTVPKHLQGSQGDCMAVIMQSIQWGMNPYAVAQKTHVVNGTLGYEAQLVNAVITSCGALRGAPNYEWFGPWDNVLGKFAIRTKKGEEGKKDVEYRVPGWSMSDEKGCGVRVFATLKGENEPRLLELMLEQASVRNSPLWASDPKQQLAYLALKRWARLHAPGAILGVYTPDELSEMQPAMKDINEPAQKNAKPADVASRKQQSAQGPSAALLDAVRAAADKGRDAFAAWWKVAKPADRDALRKEMADLQQRCEDADKKAAERTIDASAIDPETGEVVDDFVADMDKASGYCPE